MTIHISFEIKCDFPFPINVGKFRIRDRRGYHSRTLWEGKRIVGIKSKIQEAFHDKSGNWHFHHSRSLIDERLCFNIDYGCIKFSHLKSFQTMNSDWREKCDMKMIFLNDDDERKEDGNEDWKRISKDGNRNKKVYYIQIKCGCIKDSWCE